jgi:antitoxin ParD1/3/4
MQIFLNPERQKFIQEQIATGRFTEAEEVINIALELLEKLNSGYTQWIEETREKVDVAIAELERGEGLDGETVVMEILEKFRKARESHE